MRMLEKAAVKIGGGVNHRIGLFDMILLKIIMLTLPVVLIKPFSEHKTIARKKEKT